MDKIKYQRLIKSHHMVLVAKAFSLYTAMKDKDARTTPGMSSAQPS